MDVGIFTCAPACSIRKMRVKRVEGADIVRVDDFISKYLYADEPLACTIGKEEIPVPGEGFGSHIIPQGHSRLAEDQDGNIIGVSLNDQTPQSLDNIYSFTKSDKKFQDLFDYLQEASRVFKTAPDALELRMLVVHPDFRNCGVASRLIEESISASKEAGYSWVKMYCTSFYSSRLLAKKGWTLLYSKTYTDLQEKFPELPLPQPPHTTLDLYIKSSGD